MARVQATSFLYLFFLFNLARPRPHSFTIDQSDPSLVRFSGNWNTTSYSSAIGGSYALASEPAARVSIALPRTSSGPPNNLSPQPLSSGNCRCTLHWI